MRSQKFGMGDKNQIRKMKTKKRSSLGFNAFICPDLGEVQKKRSSL